ncbi:MAG: hypothetical protein LDL13_02270 [Calditerrivibrio sp.]|nr:hypothetical protein [Calditerrivibrio sp.]MCA1932388.1 hypothetical protein [Calditerrivibrio sp.]MCA1980770.1 hypothetical protein [Calditerrivibrio sp.]
MPRKIVKNGDFKGVSSFEFKVFSNVDRGITSFSFKPINIHAAEKKEKEVSPQGEDSDEKLSIKPDELQERMNTEYQRGLAEGYKNGFEAGKIEGFNEGFSKGVSETEEKLQSEYEAKKHDYINLLYTELEHVRSYISKLDSYLEEFDNALPQILIKFIQEIVGLERKINDKLIINIVKKSLSKLRDIEILDFIVNPKDVETVKEYFQGYNVIGDPSIMAGSLRVKTKIGEADFMIESVIEDLTKNIYEELGIN